MVKDVREKRTEFMKICKSLDTNWESLHEHLVKKGLSTRLQTYEKFIHGGGSPAYHWLEAMQIRYPKLEINLFKRVAEKKERGDIVLLLEDGNFIGQAKFISDLTYTQLRELSEKLDVSVNGIVANWRDFASHYKYSYKECQVFLSQLPVPNEYSPTEHILNDFLNANEDFSVSEFADLLTNMKRIDVKNALCKPQFLASLRNQAVSARKIAVVRPSQQPQQPPPPHEHQRPPQP